MQHQSTFSFVKNQDGFIDGQELRDVCFQLNVPIEDEMLTLLMSYCCGSSSEQKETEKSPLIDYVKFANFLNWKDKLPVATDEKGDSSVCMTSVTLFNAKPASKLVAVAEHMQILLREKNYVGLETCY